MSGSTSDGDTPPTAPTLTTPWSKYPKMSESTQSWASLPAGEWLVCEKVHGANFSVLADSSGTTHFSKRSGPLAPAEDFYSFRSAGLDATCAAAAHRLLAALSASTRGRVESVCVYGELCGGHYPHPEVAPSPGVAAVQRGIWYSPRLEFVGFDVSVGEAGAPPGAERRFLDFAEARLEARAAGFHFVAPLAQGSLQHCLDVPIRFASRVPAMLGLPSLPDVGVPNLAEGVVVRAAREAAPGLVGGGKAATGKGGARAMFKRKIEEFSEKMYRNDDWKEARGGGSGGGSGGNGGGGGGGADEEELLRYEMLAAVTENRLAAVVSKVGRVNVTDRAACRALLDLFVDDVIEQLEADGLVPSAAALQASRVGPGGAAGAGDGAADGAGAGIGGGDGGGGAGRYAALMAELDAESRKLVARHLRSQPPLTQGLQTAG